MTDVTPTRWWNLPSEVEHPAPRTRRHEPRIKPGIELADVERAIIGDGIMPGIEGWERAQLLEQVYRLAELYEEQRAQAGSEPSAE